LFHEYITQAFIPDLASVRGRTSHVDEIAMLLMDSASPHVSDRIVRPLGESWVLAMIFAAHTINIFQALDFDFLG
jgi:hypothetical protein